MSNKSDWNSNQYMKFAAERTQPSRDLISRLCDLSPKRVLDIGCGPGNSTAALKNRFPDAEIIGVDASDNMLEKARATYPDMHFVKCFVPDGLSMFDGGFDLIFSNACIHWIDNQEDLLKGIVNKLTDGGVLAVQIPYIQTAPFYKMLGSVVSEPKWQSLSSIKNFHNLYPEEYYDLLGALGCDFQIWETTYYHRVSSHFGVIEWYKGSGLRPYLDALGDDERSEFDDELLKNIKSSYPVQADGTIILKMPRIFFTATKK